MRPVLILALLCIHFASIAQVDPIDNIGRPSKYVDLKKHDFQGDWYMMIGSDPQYPFPPQSLKEASKEKKQAHSKVAMVASVMNTLKVNELSGTKLKGLILNGDLTNNGSEEYLEVYQGIYKNLEVSLYPGLGNHDFNKKDENAIRSIQYLLKTVNSLGIPAYTPDRKSIIQKMLAWKFDEITFNNPDYSFDFSMTNKIVKVSNVPMPQVIISGSLAYSWEVGNLHFVQLNNHPVYTHEASVGVALKAKIHASLAWLYGDLQQARERGKQIILNWHQMGTCEQCHFPIPLDRSLQSGSQLSSGSRDEMNRLIAEMFNKFDVLAIFVGHEHDAFGTTSQTIEYKGNRILNAPVFKSGAIFNNNLFLLEFFENEGRFVIHRLRSWARFPNGILSKPEYEAQIDINNPYQINYQ